MTSCQATARATDLRVHDSAGVQVVRLGTGDETADALADSGDEHEQEAEVDGVQNRVGGGKTDALETGPLSTIRNASAMAAMAAPVASAREGETP